MMNYKVGDIVVSTVDNHLLRCGREYIIREVRGSTLEVSPITSQHCDIRIIASACIFKPVKKVSLDYPSFNRGDILLRREANQVIASSGAIEGSATFTNNEEFERAAHVALSSLFEQQRAENFNLQICIVDGDDTFKTGQLYDIKKGKLTTRNGATFPAEGRFHSYKDVEDFFTPANDDKAHWVNPITYVIVSD